MYLYYYHYTGYKEGNLIRNMYFSIKAQLICQDPLLYAIYVNLQTDYATILIAYLYPSQFYLKTSVVDATYYEGEPGKVLTSNAIQDEVVISGGALRVARPSASQEAIRRFVR